MLIGGKDLARLFAVAVVTGCAVFVCALFLHYQIDLAGMREEISSLQGQILYDAQVATGKVVIGVTGGCLTVTTAVLLIFYSKNFIESRSRELGILKAMGYSALSVAARFWVFGLSVLVGAGLGYAAAAGYMPCFYEKQNAQGLFPSFAPAFHGGLSAALLLLPTAFFAALSVIYAFFRLKRPVMTLLRDSRRPQKRPAVQGKKIRPFLTEVRKSVLRERKMPVFFVSFSAFCFSAMVQMSLSMDDLASESFSWMILLIGLILAFVTLLLSLAAVVKANTKTVAMMKAFGYSEAECRTAVLGGYRPFAYLGFAVGTGYQYLLLRLVVDIVFAGWEGIPEYRFNEKAMAVTLAVFAAVYEGILYIWGKKIGKQSVKEIMLE